jgi:hypothetical protein
MNKNKDSSEFLAITQHCDASHAIHITQNPNCSTDLQGLSAYQNIQGARRADFVDTHPWLG